MQVSLRWLNDYVPITDIEPAAIAETLTGLGLEVESIEAVSPFKGQVLVGEIIGVKPHPNAEKLNLCDVSYGGNKPLAIVCGAPNARNGLKVAVAMVGAELPGNLKIKETSIRSQLSQGMLASCRELGISDDHEGILELAPTTKIGANVADILGLADTVLTVNITPNRPDCLGYLGIAREIAAKFGLPLKPPTPPKESGDLSLKTSDKLTVKINDPEDCGRFSALYVKNVSNVPSPLWLARRLEACGMRPLNLIVDITNYVMLEYGQPIHAYDERDIEGRLIEVRRARSGETLKTLDGTVRPLVPDDIVIADSVKTIGLAGIMGGEGSAIKPDTKNIIIEVAHFNPTRIRRSAKRLGLHTEASHRFERGTDMGATVDVLLRVAALLENVTQELASSSQNLPYPLRAAESIDEHINQEPLGKVALRLNRTRQLLGHSLLSQEECVAHLTRLGFKCLDKTEGRMLFEIPSYRKDIEREVDLIEEIARLMGYDKIPSTLPLMEIGAKHEDPYLDFSDRAKITMAQCGLTEIISFPFNSARDLDLLRLSPDHPLRSVVELANPLAEEQRFLQTNLIANLVQAVARNHRHGRHGSRLFELARCFRWASMNPAMPEGYLIWRAYDEQGRHIVGRGRQDDRPIERYLIGGILDQPALEKCWHDAETPATFFDAKAVVLEFLGNFGIKEFQVKPAQPDAVPWVVPGQSAFLYIGGRFSGYCGELHPETVLAYDLDLEQAPIVFELDLQTVFEATLPSRVYKTETSKFPPVTRDLALVVPRNLYHANIVETLKAFPKRRYLDSFQLFDIYLGENLPQDKKSMAYSFFFRSPERTLRDEDVDQEIAALVNWLRENLGAELR